MAKVGTKLTKEQRAICDEGVDYLRDESNAELLIQGAAGTGKTTLAIDLVKALVEALSQDYGEAYSVILTAPTHKAVEVLANNRIATDKQSLLFCTLHSALNITYNIDEETGAECFIRDNESKEDKLSGATLLVIDEASMLGTELLKYIETSLQNNPLLKIIYLGDIKQLPPINEASSPIFRKGIKTLELKEIVRQATDNPIIKLSTQPTLINDYKPHLVSSVGDLTIGYTYTNDERSIIRHFACHRNDTEIRYLAYTNKCVNDFNRRVRSEMYHRPHRVEIGETIIFNRPYVVSSNELYNNNEEVKIETLDDTIYTLRYPTNKKGGTNIREFKCYIANDELPILHEESINDFIEFTSYLKQRALVKRILWKDYYDVLNSFISFKHRYAMTIHKAQGSTYREVFLDLDNIRTNDRADEREKLLYTAITRASECLIIFTKIRNYVSTNIPF